MCSKKLSSLPSKPPRKIGSGKAQTIARTQGRDNIIGPGRTKSSEVWLVVQGRTRRRGRVLVVDAELELVGTLRPILRTDHDVVSARPTDAVAKLMAGERYDAIVCELSMPRLSGIDIHKALVHYCPAQAERMVFVLDESARNVQGVFLSNMSLPCLRRPLNEDMVRTTVRKVVGT